MKMKTLLPLSFVAALGAFVLLPVSFEISLSVLTVTGLAAIVVADYTRALRPRLAPTGAGVPVARRRERLQLAG